MWIRRKKTLWIRQSYHGVVTAQIYVTNELLFGAPSKSFTAREIPVNAHRRNNLVRFKFCTGALMRYRGKYFPALWLDMRGHPTCRRSRACVAGHVSLVRACSGQRFPLVIRCDAYIRCGLHPWARRKRSICVVTSWTKYSSMDVFSVQFLVTCPEGEEERGDKMRI